MAELVCAASDPDWLDCRKAGITATDITVICGLVTWDSPWALWHRKKGLLLERPASDRMRLGSWLEGSICDRWRELGDSNRAVQHGGLYRSDARLWQMATPDYLTVSPDGVLECKTSATRDGWGEDSTGQVPAHVRAQVLWQMDVIGVGTGHVAVVFLPSGEFRSYTIQLGTRELEEIDGMRDAGFGFWSKLLTDEPPPLDGLEVTTDALRELHAGAVKGKSMDLSDNGWAEQYDHWAAVEAEASDAKRAILNVVRSEMGDATVACHYQGQPEFRRDVFKRREYTVAAGVVDRLVRVKPKQTGDDDE